MAFNALRRLPGVEAYRYEARGDPRLFGRADFHVCVDWAEDALGMGAFIEPRPLAYWMSDTHISDGSRSFRFRKAERADRVFCSIWSDPDRLKERGIKATWLPYAAESLLWKPMPEIKQVKHIGFVGHYNHYPARAEFLERMLSVFPNFLIRWRTYFEEAVMALASCQVVLNHCQTDAVNQRVFEVLSMGACLLTPETSDLALLGLEDEVHLLTYRSTEEAIAKCRMALASDDLRQRLGQAGRAWVLAAHTYLHRACALLDRPIPDNLDELLKTPPGRGVEWGHDWTKPPAYIPVQPG